MSDCIFCRIAKGEMQADVVYSNDEVVAFRDINPQAPVHVLVVPRRHLESILDLEEGDDGLLFAIFKAIREVAEREGIADRGVRVVTNVREEAGQSVFHLHFHVLGGRRMTWPPG
ncbi:MAG: histidine triad nucleotide-binding protein [Candidatus Geothermincolales bacterium]